MCVTSRMGDAPQRELLRSMGHSDKDIDTFKEVDAKTRQTLYTWITAEIGGLMRPSQHDILDVSDLHVLVNSSDQFGRAIGAVEGKNGIVFEIRSGASSDKPGAFAAALSESIHFISGKQPRADRSTAAIRAAQKRAERLSGHLPPMGRIEQVMNNHAKYKTEADGIAYLNSLGFKRKINKSMLHRWSKRNPITGEPAKIKLDPRRPGPKNWND